MSYQQYFDRYAEPEVQQIHNFPQRYFDQVLCIPAFDEAPDFIEHIQTSALQYDGKVLLILIVNQIESSANNQRNIELVRFIEKNLCIWKSSSNIQLYELSSIDILLVDRYTQEKKIPDKEGVGLARKIACDIAAYLYQQKKIKTHQLFCSDADVIFPDNYFSTKLDKNCSAATFEFKHIANENSLITNATHIYEQSLYHYVNSLKQAGSNYAFQTIGSCLLLNMEYYLKARGFPKRPAAEDFYLLNKLQKLAPITTLTTPTILIQSRLSHRVPFGTGPAVEKLLNGNPKQACIFYHPYCFSILNMWLVYLNARVEQQDDKLSLLKGSLEWQYIEELAIFFELEAQFNKIFNHYSAIKSRKMHIHQWFDGFKTLKTVHYLRDKYFPSISYLTLNELNKNNV